MSSGVQIATPSTKKIFSFERVREGRYEGKEWEEIVKPVIEKWGGFVEAFL